MKKTITTTLTKEVLRILRSDLDLDTALINSCTLKDFTIGEWETITVGAHTVEVAPAKTRGVRLDGVVYKLDGVFQGFTGTKEAAMFWAKKELCTIRGRHNFSKVRVGLPEPKCLDCGLSLTEFKQQAKAVTI